MYLKVYYYHGKDATIDEVKAALPPDLKHLKVDEPFGIACVEFPDGTPHADWERVQKVLQAAGFETE